MTEIPDAQPTAPQFHRLFVCRTCGRTIGGCSHGRKLITEEIDSCAICARNPSPAPSTR